MARALNAYGLCMGMASVFGQVVGGLLIHIDLFGWGWRSCFLINLPIGLVAIALALRIVPESRAPIQPQLDLTGMMVISLALFAATLPLIEGREQGWPLWSWLSMAGAAVLFLVFVVYENRLKLSGAFPPIDFSLFSERPFAVGLLARLIFLVGSHSDAARILLEAAHASEAFAVAKWRATADEDRQYCFAVAL